MAREPRTGTDLVVYEPVGAGRALAVSLDDFARTFEAVEEAVAEGGAAEVVAVEKVSEEAGHDR